MRVAEVIGNHVFPIFERCGWGRVQALLVTLIVSGFHEG